MTEKSEKNQALKLLEKRKVRAKKEGRVNNSELYAGSPMYFYCRHCGLETDVLPEEYEPCPGSPRKVCSPCEELEEKGWIS